MRRTESRNVDTPNEYVVSIVLTRREANQLCDELQKKQMGDSPRMCRLWQELCNVYKNDCTDCGGSGKLEYEFSFGVQVEDCECQKGNES